MSQANTLPTVGQLTVIFGGAGAECHGYLQALRDAGAPITVDTCHAVKVLGISAAKDCARLGWTSSAGRRALGLL